MRLFDDKNNRLDVARCIAEHNLVGGDLLQILAQWPENETNNKIKSRIALACVELLTPLTWALPKEEDMAKDQRKHIPHLALAQVEYKRQIINFDGARILHTATRVALPAIAVPLKERSNRDNNIIRMLLYFLRNIAMIEPPRGRENEGDEAEISRSALIDAFQYQDVLYLLLALCSGDFGHQDVVILEVLFHLIKGIDIDTLFMNEKQNDEHQVNELADLRSREAGMHRSYQRTAPSRHGRFGVMVQVSRGDGKVSTLSGQDALLDSAKVLAKMDGYKKSKPKPVQRRQKDERGDLNFDKTIRLAPRAQKSMKEFVGDFLDSGFNPLFLSLRKAIDGDAERVENHHRRQFFYLVAWFLQAERARRESQRQQKGKSAPSEDSFSLVAAVLDQPMFITINRTMEEDLDDRKFQDLKADMRCFTQILLTVQDMYDSPLEEDVEIAENILQRIFHEETTHDRVVKIISNYHFLEGDKDFGYLDACTELAHVFLRLLENFSKVNKDMHIKSRKRKRRRKAKVVEANENVDLGNDDSVDEADDDARYVRESKERKFNFNAFAAKFVTQNCVNTFIKLLHYYNELKPKQLKRCHRYFHRVAFKMEMSVMLFRLDIIALLNKMTKGPGGLDRASKTFKEWNDLVVHILRLMTKKLKEKPELYVEMLFSKNTYTAKYLTHGPHMETFVRQKPARELEVKKSVPVEQWIATVVSALLDRNEAHLLEWFKSELFKAETERRSWEDASQALQSIEGDSQAPPPPAEDDGESGPPPAERPQPVQQAESAKAPSVMLKHNSSPTIKKAILKDGFLRLLMTLCGLQQIGDELEVDGSVWVIPSSLTADGIKANVTEIKKAEFDPLTADNYGDGHGAEWHIKSVYIATTKGRKAEWDDDSDGADFDDDEELFPMGGPTNIHKKDALALLRKKNRTNIRVGEEKELTEEQLEERRRNKERRDREKQRKVKSQLFVRDSDEDTDEERDRGFFEREERLRRAKDEGKFVAKMEEKADKKKARKRVAKDETMDDEDDVLSGSESELAESSAHSSPEPEPQPAKKKPRKRTPKRKVVEPQTDYEDDSLDSADRGTLEATPKPRRASAKRAKLSEGPADAASPEPGDEAKKADVEMVEMVDLDESEDELPLARPRKRVVSGFMLDSSDEE